MGMLSRLFFNRKKGWSEINFQQYQSAYQQYAGSVLTHPEFVQAMSAVTQIETTFYGWFEDEQLIAATPVWGKYLAGHKKALKKASCRHKVDMGNAEVILPIAKQIQLTLPCRADHVSCVNQSQIKALKKMSGDGLAMLKSYSDGDFSKKFKYNQRREQRLLIEAGCAIQEIQEFTNEQIVSMYDELFAMRFGKSPKAISTLAEFLSYVRPFLFGHVLLMNNKAIAMQIVYLVETATHISAEYINGGVNTGYLELSPGSVLTFINTQAAEQYAITREKPLRYSFGHADTGYKSRWCHNSAIFRV